MILKQDATELERGLIMCRRVQRTVHPPDSYQDEVSFLEYYLARYETDLLLHSSHRKVRKRE
jgi:hypothetical protein